MEGSHSPFGVIWQMASAAGWKVKYIMWGINYQTLVMMLADQVRYVSAEEANRRQHKTGGAGGSGALSFFQTKLDEQNDG